MRAVDEQAADALLARLMALGLVEEKGGGLGPTRRWNARIQAASERINQQIAATGVQPLGNPLMLSVAKALEDERTPLAPAEFDDAVRMLVVLELSRMKPEKREQLGFGNVTL